MKEKSEWTAKLALTCYLALVGGIFMASLIMGIALLGLRTDYLDLPFPIALISIPVSETIILGITLLFAKSKGSGLKTLGLKKASLRILTIVSFAAVPLFLLGAGISIAQEMVFGPDPMTELIEKALAPRDPFQLAAMIALSLVVVGPCQELAFRGFVQRGLENSFGKMKGLFIASVLFGLVHGLNSLHSFAPAFFGGLILGYVWQRTDRNTTASALMHGTNNSISIALTYFLTV